MNHVEELNRLIDLAARRPDFDRRGHLPSGPVATGQVKEEKNNLFFTCSVLGMEAISHVIEDQAINLGGEFRFYSAFQKLSRMKPQEERYRRLLETGNPVYVFGEEDYDPAGAANLIKVRLDNPDDPAAPRLARNWFVILYNPDFISMGLVAREVPSGLRLAAPPDKLIFRNFEGFWTYNSEIISSVVTILDDYIQRCGTN